MNYEDVGYDLSLYRHMYREEIIYIGKTNREISKRSAEEPNIIKYSDRIESCKMRTETDLGLAEDILINQLKPVYNRKNKYKGLLTYDIQLNLKWERAVIPIGVNYRTNGFYLEYVNQLIKILLMINNKIYTTDICNIIRGYITAAQKNCNRSYFHNQQIIWERAGSKSIIIKGKKYNNPNGLLIKFPSENLHYSKMILSDLVKQMDHYLRVFGNHGIDVYVEDKESYLQRNRNFMGLFRNIELAYLARTRKNSISEIIIATHKEGYYFAWESPFPDNVELDNEFIKKMNYSFIISEYRKGNVVDNLIQYHSY